MRWGRGTEQGAMGRTAGGRLSDGGCVSCVAGVEFDNVPAHVFCDGPCHGGFPDTGWTDEEDALLFRRPVLPFIKPRTNLASLNFVALEQLFGPRAMSLGPIARLTHALRCSGGFFNLHHAAVIRCRNVANETLQLSDSIGTRCCSPVSRSRRVTVRSSSDWWSTVMQTGTPISSALA